jgi:hypothetical protein
VRGREGGGGEGKPKGREGGGRQQADVHRHSAYSVLSLNQIFFLRGGYSPGAGFWLRLRDRVPRQTGGGIPDPAPPGHSRAVPPEGPHTRHKVSAGFRDFAISRLQRKQTRLAHEKEALPRNFVQSSFHIKSTIPCDFFIFPIQLFLYFS